MNYRFLAAISLVVLASGCQRKAEGQTVAVVNGDEITAPDLNFALNQARIPEGANKDAARNQVLQQLVDRRILAQQARKEGIDKSPEFLNRERRGDEDLLISMLAARRLNTAQLPSDREVQTYIGTHPEVFDKREVWTLDQMQYPTPTDKTIQAEIVATHSMDQLAAVLQKHNIQFQRRKSQLDTAVIPPDIYGKLASAPAGEPFVVPVGDKSVASGILGREPHPIAGDQAKPIAVDAMRKQQTAKGLEDMVKSLRNSGKIEYQPGYAPPASAAPKK